MTAHSLLQQAYLLECQIQPYAWGSHHAIANLLGQPTPSSTPQAELWMGAHSKAPALLLAQGQRIPLDQWIQKDPGSILGQYTAQDFAKLPYLYKVLAAAQPLSIQAHPNKQQAERGFAKEEAAGIPPGAFHRNYKDDNHKPELICALTPFWALKGFRTPQEIQQLFAICPIPELEPLLAPLAETPQEAAVEQFFAGLMSLSREAQRTLAAKVRACVDGASTRKGWEAQPEAAWIERLGQSYPDDLGILAPLYLHLIQLQPGQALYLDAGELHAYLEGTGIELMANSDNVLRGGLTPKHIDLPELLSVLTFQPNAPQPLTPQPTRHPQEERYKTPAREFQLSHIQLVEGTAYQAESLREVEILLCIKGTAQLNGPRPLQLTQGSVCFVPAAHPAYQLRGDASLYKATMPAASDS